MGIKSTRYVTREEALRLLEEAPYFPDRLLGNLLDVIADSMSEGEPTYCDGVSYFDNFLIREPMWFAEGDRVRSSRYPGTIFCVTMVDQARRTVRAVAEYEGMDCIYLFEDDGWTKV